MTAPLAVAWVLVVLTCWLFTRWMVGTRALHIMGESRFTSSALFVLVLLTVVAVLAPVLAPFDPLAQPDVVEGKSLPPSLMNLFGTDTFSRDVFSRIVVGARYSLSVALIAVFASILLGTCWGATAAAAGGRVDEFMMRIVDALLSVPRVLLLIAVTAMMPRVSVVTLALLIGCTGWFGVSRMVRAVVRNSLQEEYVMAARAIGVGPSWIVVSHIMPNIVSTIVVAATLGLGHAIVLEAGLAYLGIGLQPELPSWGRILREGSDNPGQLWWLSVFPGMAIVAGVMALNAVGDGLRDAVANRQLVAGTKSTNH